MADQLARLRDSSDALLIDCGSNLSERSISLALQSDLAVLVATPEPTALTDAYATAKILLRRGYRNNVGLVVNMTRSRREANETVRRLLRAASHFLGLSLQRLGEIPFDRHATQAARLRRPVLLASPRCAAAQAVEQVARRLPLAEPLTPVTDNALWVRVASLFL
jgi:flagellar biosynthesis protein FlhG